MNALKSSLKLVFLDFFETVLFSKRTLFKLYTVIVFLTGRKVWFFLRLLRRNILLRHTLLSVVCFRSCLPHIGVKLKSNKKAEISLSIRQSDKN